LLASLPDFALTWIICEQAEQTVTDAQRGHVMKALLYDKRRSERLKKWECFALTPRNFLIALASSFFFSFYFYTS